jgi:hypothetical protein
MEVLVGGAKFGRGGRRTILELFRFEHGSKEMSVRAFTDDANGLLTKIKKLINQGRIDTWVYDKDGDFTHTPPQWKTKAWFRPQVKPDMLRLVIFNNKNATLTREIFAVYHGRFIEMLIAHVPDDFESLSASPNPVSGDEPSLDG